jgi:AhpD family alkylhydroperoxidase
MNTMKLMKMATVALAALAFAPAVHAQDKAAAAARADVQKTLGFVPQFLNRFPDEAVPGVWEEVKGLQMNPHTALPGITKELIGLGVAAQIPCRYCVIGHTEFARLNGASEAQVGEAVAMAALTRHWSTFLNGIQTDETSFRAELARIGENAKKGNAGQPLGGYVPEFVRAFPEAGRAGAWRVMRDVQLSTTTALTAKQKELVGLAVASQIPCRYCIVAHTEFAKLSGASDAEIKEAIAMASLTREMSTLLNGMQVDETQFRHDIDHLVKGAKAAAKKSPTKSPTTAER